MPYSPEDCYQYYHMKMSRINGKPYRQISNWDNIKKKHKSVWGHFERLAEMLNRTNIKLESYIDAITEIVGGWVNPSILATQKGVRMYKAIANKDAIKSHEEPSEEKIQDISIGLVKSIKHIKGLREKFPIRTIEDYIKKDCLVFPLILSDLLSNNISSNFVLLIPSLDSMLHKNWPPDMIDELNKIIYGDIESKRKTLLSISKFKILSDNLERIIVDADA